MTVEVLSEMTVEVLSDRDDSLVRNDSHRDVSDESVMTHMSHITLCMSHVIDCISHVTNHIGMSHVS